MIRGNFLSRTSAQCTAALVGCCWLALVVGGCGRATNPGGAIAIGTGGVAGGGAMVPDPVGTGGATPVLVESSSGRRLRRLSSREYNNVVRDLLGDTTRPADAFIVDSFQNGYDNGSAGLAVQSDQVESYQLAAELLAVRAIAEQLPLLLDGCDPAVSGEVACAQAFFQTFPARAFRRPLSDGELGRLRVVFDEAVAIEPDAAGDASGFTLGLRTVIETILQSPQFLYREELGAVGTISGNPRQVRLTSFEVASELSFLLTGTMPDAPLFAAAAAGRLETSDDLRREARRLLGTAGAPEVMRAFLHQWLATDRLTQTTKDLAIYPTFNLDLARSMSTELDQLFDAVVWNGTGTLRELFTTSRSFVDPALASLYGVIGPSGGFAPANLDATNRKGVLTRAGFLAAHADQDSSGPIARGVFVLNSVLCTAPLQRPAIVPVPPSVADATAGGKTTRQRFEQHATDGQCTGCHRIIDGVGFAFEEFDAVGAFRAAENGSPVDSSGRLYTTRDINGTFVGASELAMRMVEGHDLPDCFVKQLYRFAMGEVESTSPALLVALQDAFSVDVPISELMLALVSDPLFVVRATARDDVRDAMAGQP